MEEIAFFTLSYASGTFILFLTTGFLAYISRQKTLKTWTSYWGVLTVAYSSLYTFEQTNAVFYSLIYVSAVITASFLFIYGVYNLLHKPFKKNHALVFLAIMIILTINNSTLSNDVVQVFIQSLLISVFFFWGSILLFMKKTKFYVFLGILGVVLALNYTFFPLIYNTSWYMPFGFIIIGIAGMLFGLGIIAHYLVHVNQEYESMQKELTYMIYHDALTNVYNRAYFDEEISFHQEEKTFPFSMIVLDLNDLKQTNDQYGHRRGDTYLVALADILQSVIQSSEDKVIRYGGDEFVVLLPFKTLEEASKLVTDIKHRVEATVTRKLTLSVAIGTATRKHQEEALSSVFDRAEKHMYANKNAM